MCWPKFVQIDVTYSNIGFNEIIKKNIKKEKQGKGKKKKLPRRFQSIHHMTNDQAINVSNFNWRL